MAQIECKDLTLAYEGKVVAEDISFSVHAGDYLCIVGENGSGKSTLVKGLLGLKAPAGGTISYKDGLQKGGIGYLPQGEAAMRDFPASVWEVVMSGFVGRFRGCFFTKAQKEIATAQMEALGILSLKNTCYRELSGGQQQRVRLARALVGADRLLLLDEPTAGLDPKASHEFYTLVEKLNRKRGITVIMVSHDTGAPFDSATHILHLKHRQLFFGTKDAYLASDIGRAFLGGDSVCGK